MKVLSIQPRKTQTAEQKPYWKCRLEGSQYPLIVWDEPSFQVGDDIPREKLLLSGDIWTFAAETHDKDSSIREQTAIKIIADIFNVGKLKEFEESSDSYVVNLREWVNAALVHGPLMANILEQHPKKGKGK